MDTKFYLLIIDLGFRADEADVTLMNYAEYLGSLSLIPSLSHW